MSFNALEYIKILEAYQILQSFLRSVQQHIILEYEKILLTLNYYHLI